MAIIDLWAIKSISSMVKSLSLFKNILSIEPIVQWIRTFVSGAKGRRFKSCLAHQLLTVIGYHHAKFSIAMNLDNHLVNHFQYLILDANRYPL